MSDNLEKSKKILQDYIKENPDVCNKEDDGSMSLSIEELIKLQEEEQLKQLQPVVYNKRRPKPPFLFTLHLYTLNLVLFLLLWLHH